MLLSRTTLRIVFVSGCIALASVQAQDSLDYSLPADATNLTVGAKTQAAIQTAINSAQDASRIVYIPAGTYEITSTLGGNNGYYRFMTLWGAGTGKTVLKLKDSCPGFTDSLNPKPVVDLYFSNNATHSCFFRNLTIDVGKGNPGAIGLEFNSHNGGIVDNVRIVSQDLAGYCGLSMMKTPGPALVTNLSISGFKYGIQTGTMLYSMTLADITLENQGKYGVYNVGVPLSIVNLVSRNSVQAIRNGGASMSLVNSTLTYTGTSPTTAVALISESSIYVRNLVTSGYSASLLEPNARITEPTIAEHISAGLITAANTAPHALRLPIKNPPRVAWNSDLSQWANVRSFASPQAAFNSGKAVVYFPNLVRGQSYTGNVTVPSSVKRIIGLMSVLSGTITVDNQDSNAAVIIDQLDGFTLNHTGKSSVYIRSSGSSITTRPGAGDLFVDDHCCEKITIDHSNVWIRQLNLEVPSAPMLLNNGGNLVVMGFKTEQPFNVLQNINKAATEILGGFIYPIGFLEPGMSITGAMHVNDNSSLFVFHDNLGDYPIFAREIRDGSTTDVLKKGQTCMYVSNPDGIGGVSGAGRISSLSGTGATVSAFRNQSDLVLSVSADQNDAYHLVVSTTSGRSVYAARSSGNRQFRVPGLTAGACRIYYATITAHGAQTTQKILVK